MINNTRRNFLKTSGAGAAMVAGQSYLFGKTDVISVENGKHNYPNANYTESMYRDEFDFTYGEKEEHGYAYHCINCQGNCAWEIWSKDGVVTRENQSAKYPVINENIPDFNPRGCNKGVQHSQIMYEKDRVLYPMKRDGARGAGSWKRISWDEAATEVAQKVWDTMADEEKGPGKLFIQAGTGLLTEGRRGAPIRFCTQLGASRIYPASYLGDMFSGAAVAYGEGNLGCTYDFMFNVDVSVMWGANPSATRIPDAHFVWEGKYNGGKVIVITPEYNATAKSADLWIPIKPGTDNFLAMSVINVILEEKMFKPGFMKIFTDLPFLVDIKTKKMIRRTDIEGHGDHKWDEEFYCMNKKTGKIALMPGTEGSKDKTLRLEEFGIDPELEGEWKIKLHNGEEVEVTTAFTFLKKSAASFTPEKMQSKTGVAPDVVRQLARDIAIPKVVMITTGFSLNKYFNGIMSIWNISSIAGLTGRMGPYGGINTENEFQLSGLGALSGFAGKYSPRFGSGFVGEFLLGDGMETFKEYYNDDDVQRSQKMSKADYIKEVEMLLDAGKDGGKKDKNGNLIAKPSFDPEVGILIADSRFRRNKGSRYRDSFLSKMKYLCVVDFKMSEAAVWADLILPAKSHYEVWDIRSSPGYHRFTNLAQPVANLKPVGEAMDEWSMFSLIAKKLEEIANLPENKDRNKIPDDKRYAREGYRDLGNFFKEYTNIDEESEDADEPILGVDPDDEEITGDRLAVEAALSKCDQYAPYTVEKMYKMGGFLPLNEKAAKTSPLYADKPFNSFEDHLFKFERLETLSGRQTFYVDHPTWIKMGANVNTGIEGIKPQRAAFPYSMMTPHARWAIHSNYRTSRTLLRLQRGKPYITINPEVAKLKGIKDGEDARVFNAIGEFYAMVKTSAAAPLDGIVMEHGWEPYMFKNLKGHNEVVPTALNLLEMAEGWGHIKFGGLWDGNQYAYDGAVNFEKA